MEVVFKNKFPFVSIKRTEEEPAKQAAFNTDFQFMFTHSFDGEKSMGEIGPAKNYRMETAILRVRAWQAWIESEVAQTVVGRYIMWAIGTGLKLQSEPVADILKEEGINLDRQKFSKSVEMRWNLFRKSRLCDYAGMKNLDELATDNFKNAINGGDCLGVLRYENDRITLQLIDGAHIRTPYNQPIYPEKLANGNTILEGVELNDNREHVAYWVIKRNGLDSVRIPVKGETTGITMAFLVYGAEYRLDSVRGIPLLTTVLETLKKMERYKEATVANAEEINKIIYQITHGVNSTGENPFDGQIAKAFNTGAPTDKIPVDVLGEKMANKVGVSTNRMALNMTQDSELKAVNAGTGQLYFKDFYGVNIDLICAALGIPPNVAMSKYDSNFSASRAALKDWENTLRIARQRFADSFYQHIFNFWLDIEILKNRVYAPGYLMARAKNNTVVLDAYRCCRFVGAQVPHIDPLKEVNAERAKLGAAGAALPMTTLEASIEALNGADATEVMEQFTKELADSIAAKIVAPVKDSTTKTNEPGTKKKKKVPAK